MALEELRDAYLQGRVVISYKEPDLFNILQKVHAVLSEFGLEECEYSKNKLEELYGNDVHNVDGNPA